MGSLQISAPDHRDTDAESDPTTAGKTRPSGRPYGPEGRPGRGRLSDVAVPIDGRASLERQSAQGVKFQKTEQQGATRLVSGGACAPAQQRAESASCSLVSRLR